MDVTSPGRLGVNGNAGCAGGMNAPQGQEGDAPWRPGAASNNLLRNEVKCSGCCRSSCYQQAAGSLPPPSEAASAGSRIIELNSGGEMETSSHGQSGPLPGSKSAVRTSIFPPRRPSRRCVIIIIVTIITMIKERSAWSETAACVGDLPGWC